MKFLKLFSINPLLKTHEDKTKSLELNEIPNPNYDEGYLSYLKSIPSSDGFWEVRSGEEF